MIDILNRIVHTKYSEIESRKRSVSVEQLYQSPYFDRKCNSLRQLLVDPGEMGVIAEFKRKSPSVRAINTEADLVDVVTGYHEAGASAVSILTDVHYFGGSDEYLGQVRPRFPLLPLLRKEFIIDEYQVYESKALGADVILLISEILSLREVEQLGNLASSLGMEVLLELHGEDQLEKTYGNVSVIGVNNRNLKTFKIDYKRSIDMLKKLRNDVPKIAESGLSEPETVSLLRQSGFDGFLIGERFMKEQDPGLACREFIEAVRDLE